MSVLLGRLPRMTETSPWSPRALSPSPVTGGTYIFTLCLMAVCLWFISCPRLGALWEWKLFLLCPWIVGVECDASHSLNICWMNRWVPSAKRWARSLSGYASDQMCDIALDLSFSSSKMRTLDYILGLHLHFSLLQAAQCPIREAHPGRGGTHKVN